ncbi:MAG: hypothetical protein ABI416_03900 [Ginsengibacter sp.]
MQNYKDRLYNHEATPPPEIWDTISAGLENKGGRIFPMNALRRRSKFIFYGLTAAASLLIIFISSVIFNKSGDNANSKNSQLTENNIGTQKVNDSLTQNNKTLAAIIKSSKDKNPGINNEDDNSISKVKKYITIEGPEGQPVKISPKVATLIESADNEYPPKPVWSKKIDKWKQIMLSSTISLTSTSLLDIAQLSASLDNNE